MNIKYYHTGRLFYKLRGMVKGSLVQVFFLYICAIVNMHLEIEQLYTACVVIQQVVRE